VRPDEALLSAAAVATALGVLVALGLRVERRLRAWACKGEAVAEILLGRDEIRHPETGQVLVPATPGLGLRISTIETTLQTLAEHQAGMETLTTDNARIWQAISQLRADLTHHIEKGMTP